MLDIVKQLFENNVISEEIKSEIESAWNSRIQENRDQVTAELREEFAQKYEHDKDAMVEAVEAMLSDRLQAELGELAEDRQGLIDARAKYAAKMTQDAQAMESFVLNNLKKELAELHEDRKAVAGNVAKLESFIVDALAKEIAEFHADKKDLAETKVRLVRDSKAKFEQVKKEFITRSAQLVSETVSKGLRSEMNQLREDIDAARRNDFGRRIFESFASEYAASHLNEKSETAKLLKAFALKEQELEEAATIVAETQKLIESKETELRIARDAASRKEIMNELLGPLSGDKKNVMKELLESVQTEKLHSSFDKYLPSVMNGGAPTKKTLIEGKEITGDKKQAQSFSSEEKTAEIFDIRRLAGLKV
jgi:metal-responsive CopG/Arc/MetJ family transcriptional regulator